MPRVPIAVIGGGITGQLVKYQCPEAVVYDWHTHAPPLTRMFGANYLWEPIGDLPCTAFDVTTHVDGMSPSMATIALYKEKIGKLSELTDLDTIPRQFLAHQTGYELTMPRMEVAFGYRVTYIDRSMHRIKFANGEEVIYDHLVSTIPLYSLLSLLGMPEPTGRLKFRPIFFKVMAIPPDAIPITGWYVNYLSDPLIKPYRYCDRNGERHYESLEPYASVATKRFSPGKIYPHPAVPEYLELLNGYNIQTFGRFGSWDPDELVHQTWHRISEWKEAMG